MESKVSKRDFIIKLLTNDKIKLFKQYIPEIQNEFSDKDIDALWNGNINYNYPNHPIPLYGNFERLVGKFLFFNPFLVQWYEESEYEQFLIDFWKAFLTKEKLIKMNEEERMKFLKENNVFIPKNFDEKLFHEYIGSEFKEQEELYIKLKEGFPKFEVSIGFIISIENKLKDAFDVGCINLGPIYEKEVIGYLVGLIPHVIGVGLSIPKIIDFFKYIITTKRDLAVKSMKKIKSVGNDDPKMVGQEEDTAKNGLINLGQKWTIKDILIKALPMVSKINGIISLGCLAISIIQYCIRKTDNSIKKFDSKYQEIEKNFNEHRKELIKLRDEVSKALENGQLLDSDEKIKQIQDKINKDIKDLEALIEELISKKKTLNIQKQICRGVKTTSLISCAVGIATGILGLLTGGIGLIPAAGALTAVVSLGAYFLSDANYEEFDSQEKEVDKKLEMCSLLLEEMKKLEKEVEDYNKNFSNLMKENKETFPPEFTDATKSYIQTKC